MTGTKRPYGFGTVRYREREQRWVGTYELGRDTAGRRKRGVVYGQTRRDAAAKLNAKLREHANGTLLSGEAQTLGAYLERWLERSRVRESTRRHYRHNIAHVVPALGRVPLAKVTAEHVETLLRERAAAGLSPQSVHHVRAVLRNALGRAVALGLIARNPVTLTDAPSVPEFEARFLSVEEAQRFLAAAEGDRLEALFSVALALGLRQGEALALRWDDVDLERRTLRVVHSLERVPGGGLQLVEPKTAGSHRALVIPERTLRALRAHRARQLEERLVAGARWTDNGLVFTTFEGRPLSASHIVGANFHRICERASIAYSKRGHPGLRFHDLRHSAATLLLAQGVPQRVVMETLGHSTLRMTARYTHVVPDLLEQAAAAMDRALGS